MQVKVDEKLCRAEIQKLQEIYASVNAITIYDINGLFIESSGKTVEAMKDLTVELAILKDHIMNRMKTLVNELETYVDNYVALEKRTTTIISTYYSNG